VWGGALAGVIGLGPAIGLLTAFWTLICAAFIAFNVPRRAQDRGLAIERRNAGAVMAASGRFDRTATANSMTRKEAVDA
jgi:hypothetical protein